MNWLDWAIVLFVVLSIVGGFREGFIRIGIGFVALLIGFLGAAWFYGLLADPLLPYVKARWLANLLAFQIIFFGVMIAGAVFAALITRMFRMIGLSPIDRALGALFGAVRAGFVVVIVTLCVMAFAPRSLPAAVETSRFAPDIIRTSRVLSSLAPYELKQGFNRTFDQVQGMIKELRDPRKLVIRQE
jgi:membrane protein required for colicin V production